MSNLLLAVRQFRHLAQPVKVLFVVEVVGLAKQRRLTELFAAIANNAVMVAAFLRVPAPFQVVVVFPGVALIAHLTAAVAAIREFAVAVSGKNQVGVALVEYANVFASMITMPAN